jgi:hypothetical protein
MSREKIVDATSIASCSILKMEEIRFSEKSVDFQRTERRFILEDRIHLPLLLRR